MKQTSCRSDSTNATRLQSTHEKWTLFGGLFQSLFSTSSDELAASLRTRAVFQFFASSKSVALRVLLLYVVRIKTITHFHNFIQFRFDIWSLFGIFGDFVSGHFSIIFIFNFILFSFIFEFRFSIFIIWLLWPSMGFVLSVRKLPFKPWVHSFVCECVNCGFKFFRSNSPYFFQLNLKCEWWVC